jgi:hypothetical protein
MILERYQQLGGVHPLSACLRNALTYHGVRAPHTGEPFTEAMVLGLSGGLGVGYILWEFKKEPYPILVVAFSYRWNYGESVLEAACRRLGATPSVQETTSRAKAARQLEAALAAGQPAIVWTDLYDWTYDHHHLLNVVTVVGIDEEADEVLVDDRAPTPIRVPREAFADARVVVPSYKNRLMLVEPSGDIDLEHALLEALQNCVDYLGAGSDSFALPALRKWARLLTDSNHKKGWPQVFAGQRGVYSALKGIFEGIELTGTGGSGLRPLYAEFLDEAAGVLGNPKLSQVAELYRKAAGRWTALAEAALPNGVEAFRETKALLRERLALHMAQPPGVNERIQEISTRLAAHKKELDARFPLDEGETLALFKELAEHVMGVYDAEREAQQALKSAI